MLRSVARPISPALPFLPTPPLKTGLTKTMPARSIRARNLLFTGAGIEGLGRRVPDETQHPGAVQHAGDLHLMPSSFANREDAAARLSGSFQRMSLFRSNRRSTESQP